MLLFIYWSSLISDLQVDTVDLFTEAGRRFATIDGNAVEVVTASVSDLASAGIDGQPGVYVVGSGSTGAGKTFFALGGTYFVAMLAGALGQRVPPEGWKPKVMYILMHKIRIYKKNLFLFLMNDSYSMFIEGIFFMSL